MRLRRTRIVVIICLLVVSIGLAGNLILMNVDERLSKNDTVEFTATIRDVKLNTVGKHATMEITVNEYDTKLLIAHAEQKIDNEKVESIHTGDTCYFRVQKQWLEDTAIETLSQVGIVELKIKNNEIVSLGDYNKGMDSQRAYATIAGVLVIILMLLICGFCLRKPKQKKGGDKRNGDN